MAIPLSVAAGSPMPLKLGDKTFNLRPLNDKDYGELEEWIQDRIVAVTRRNIGGLPESQQTALLARAFEKAAEVTLTSIEGMRMMRTAEGAIKMLFFALRGQHPELKEADVANMLSDPAVLLSAQRMLERVERQQANAVKEASERLPKFRAAGQKKRKARRRR